MFVYDFLCFLGFTGLFLAFHLSLWDGIVAYAYILVWAKGTGQIFPFFTFRHIGYFGSANKQFRSDFLCSNI